MELNKGSLQDDDWEILPDGFLSSKSLDKLQKLKEEFHEYAKEYLKRPEVIAQLNTKFKIK